MAGEGEKSNDFYAVMGLKKECSDAELRNAYKKLALRWHPDRCSASGNLKYVEEAKKKFQAIQQAYSVLSDANKRFLYDVGVYSCDDDDDENGMGDFLNEMATMMSQNKSNEENGEGSFEELKELFEEMFESDAATAAFDYSTSSSSSSNKNTKKSTSSSISSAYASPTSCFSSAAASSPLFSNYGENSNKRGSSGMMMRNADKSNQHSSSSSPAFEANFHGFCFGAEQVESTRGGGEMKGSRSNMKRRSGRKQKFSAAHDVSSTNYYYGSGGGGVGGSGGGGISAA